MPSAVADVLSELDELIAQAEAEQGTWPPLHAAQLEVESELARFNVVNCGRRWGKTEYGVRKVAEVALAGRPVAYLAPTYRMVEIAYESLTERLVGFVARKVEGHRIELTTGGSIDLWSMENGADRVRGRKYARVVLDECALVTDLVAVWERVVRPTLADLQGDAFFLSTPRRGGGFQELYKRAETQPKPEKGEQPEWRSWQMPTERNPFILASEIQAARLGSSEQTFAQEWLADFEASESDLVYPEFDRNRHILPPPCAWESCRWRVVGIDPGGGDPTAIVPLGVGSDSQGERMHQYGEFYRRGDVSIESVAEYLSKLGPVHYVAVGETGGNVITNSLRALGFPAVRAEMGRYEGIDQVRLWLQRGRLTISPECVNSIAEFAGYRWAKQRDPETGDRYATSAPRDHHADAMDARRYAVMAVMQATQRGRGGPVEVRYAG